MELLNFLGKVVVRFCNPSGEAEGSRALPRPRCVARSVSSALAVLTGVRWRLLLHDSPVTSDDEHVPVTSFVPHPSLFDEFSKILPVGKTVFFIFLLLSC